MQSRVDKTLLHGESFPIEGSFFCCLRQEVSHGLHGFTRINFYCLRQGGGHELHESHECATDYTDVHGLFSVHFV